MFIPGRDQHVAHFLLRYTWGFDDLYQTVRLGCHHDIIVIMHGTLQAGPSKLALCIGYNHIIILLIFVIFTLTDHWVAATQCHR